MTHACEEIHFPGASYRLLHWSTVGGQLVSKYLFTKNSTEELEPKLLVNGKQQQFDKKEIDQDRNLSHRDGTQN